MHALKSVIVGALATTVSATYMNGQALRREVFRAASSSASGATVKRPYPTATASTNSSNVCDSVLNGLATVLTELPTPTVPSSIGPAFSTYESAVISFYSAHKSQLNSAVSACPNLTILVENPVCSTAASSSNKTIPPATPIPTPTEPVRGTATSTPKTSVISTGSTGSANEMREKSAVAVFAVGVVGVVAMLL